ncbi:MAG: SBBP repeat-containing protein [Chloroflexi bacterium]|nr:SBBP repeat-containing protein [Chloroflexota bacterium]
MDGVGSAYLVGTTGSVNFPATPGALDTTANGSAPQDAFVAKLDPTGSRLAYATFLGGTSAEWGHAIAVDAAGSAYVTGRTASVDFPVTAGAFDTSHNGTEDAFVAKLDPDGSTLVYATLLGSNNGDGGWSIAVDGTGNAHVAGTTFAPANFPTTAGAFSTSYNGGERDAFVVKLNSTTSLRPRALSTPPSLASLMPS